MTVISGARAGIASTVPSPWTSCSASGVQPPGIAVIIAGPAKKVLELTFREALRLGHNYIGTEHILLALLEHEDGDGPLHSAGIGKDRADADLKRILASMTIAQPD